MSAQPAHGGRGLKKTHPARRTGASGNLEAAEKAETWRASLCGLQSGEGPGRDACPESRRDAEERGSPRVGAPPFPGQDHPPTPTPAPGPRGERGPSPPRSSHPLLLPQAASRTAASYRSRNFASLMETEPRASSLLPRPPSAPISSSRVPPSGRDLRGTEDQARLHCRTGWGAAGVRIMGTRAPATRWGPARAQGGRPAASALSAPHPSPSCPHPTLPRLLPSQPTPAPRPPRGRRDSC